MRSSRPSVLSLFLVILVLLALCVPQVTAFGAGNIPSFAYLEGKAFRHGDIEDTLKELIKKGSSAGGVFALGSLIKKGSKFGNLDVKRIYFGNWLRDYSQAVDIAGLKKLQLQTIINLCMVFGFMAHGYVTNEFEVTEERLGVYLPTEHIDNPKGYGDGEDARKYHPRLRGPVDPRELEVDPRTGMKNYIANESGHWDTSKGLVRRTLEQCIHIGRQHRAQGRKQDEYEAYRLLGQLLHTLEDFPAHSNFCELALVSLGCHQVFVHVGDHVRIQAPSGKWVAPLVTGTFGGSDFIHSLLGEATDHISQVSISDLSKDISQARSRSNSDFDPASALRELFGSLPGGSGSEMTREMQGVERIRVGEAAGGRRPEDMSPQELHQALWQVLSFRDSVVKKIEKTIENIPGLEPLVEKILNSITIFVLNTLEPLTKPLLQTASTGLSTGSAAVIDNHDQYEVFNDPRASDPTHSFLSKDHFNLILNEPAGHLAKLIVAYTVKLVVKAWDDTSVNVHHLTEDVLSCLFHPDFHDPRSQIQREMMQFMHDWLIGHGSKQHEIIGRLSKDAVRNHYNIRPTDDSGGEGHAAIAGYDAGTQEQSSVQGYLNNIPGVQKVSATMGSFGNEKGEARVAVNTEGESYRAPLPVVYAPPTVTSGEAAAYYGSSTGPAAGGGHSFSLHTGHQPMPQGGAPGCSYNGSPSFPGGAPPANSGYSTGFGSRTAQMPQPPIPCPGPGPGYAPTYAPPPGPPNYPSVPSFPSPQYPIPQYPGLQYGGQPQYPPPSGYPPPGNSQYNYGGGGSAW